MTALPPRQKLVHVAGSLVRRLPDRFATLLAAPPFADAGEAIGRLADPAALAAGAAAMDPAEAEWMADLLLERWARIDTVELDPAVAILGPEVIWVSSVPRDIAVGLATLGLEDDWSAEWGADAEPEDDGRRAVLRAVPIRGEDRSVRRARVRVIGRAGAMRSVVTAVHEVQVCRPAVTISADRLTLSVQDQSGQPGRHVPISIDGAEHTADSNGCVGLEFPLSTDAVIAVDGQAAAAVRWQR